jgi:hypothetical protein
LITDVLKGLERWGNDKSDSLKMYINSFLVEIAEIIVQLNEDLKLATYKIPVSDTTLYRFKLACKKFLKTCIHYDKRNYPIPYPKKDVKLIFVIEYANHLREFLALREELEQMQVPFVAIFLNKEVYQTYLGKSDNTILIGENCSRREHLIAIAKLIGITVPIILSKGFLGITSKNRIRLLVEIFYLNSKFLPGLIKLTRNLELALEAQNKKAPVIFFKSEGFRIRNLVQSCKRSGHKVIAIQHGNILVEQKYYSLPVDRYIVWSDVYKKHLENSGAECEILSLGRPSYDKIFRERHIVKNMINPERIRIIFLPNTGNSQTPKSEVIFATKLCLELAMSRATIELYIKPHPSDSSNTIKSIVEDVSLSGMVTMIDKHTSIDYMDYDIIATMNSTAGAEAAVYGRPSIILLSNRELLAVHEYIDNGIAMLATNISEFDIAIGKLVTEYNRYQDAAMIFTSMYFANPGSSTKAILVDILNNTYLAPINLWKK